jgi:hypothetical protein
VLGCKVIGNFLQSAVISFSDLPLKLAGFAGAASLLVGTCWIAALLAAWALGYSVAGWSAALAGVVWMGGLQLFATGVLGAYIGGIYFETKRRPNFIVQDTWGFESPPPSLRPVDDEAVVARRAVAPQGLGRTAQGNALGSECVDQLRTPKG